MRPFYTKQFTKKNKSTFATYDNAVRHTTSSAVFLKQNLLSLFCPNVAYHVWAFTVWLCVIGSHAYCFCYDYMFMPMSCLKYNKVPKPYLKHSDSVTTKLIWLKLDCKKKSLTQKLWVKEQLQHIWIQRGKVHKKQKLIFMWQKLNRISINTDWSPSVWCGKQIVLIWHSEEHASWYIVIIKTKRRTISQIYFGIELYMFRTGLLSIIRSLVLYSQRMVFVIQVMLTVC